MEIRYNMVWCLVKEKADKIKTMLKSGKINPDKLAKMTSKERRAFFNSFGEENAKKINALFESKLLLKNQKRGMITWAKKISGISKDAKRDILSRINRLDKVLDVNEEKKFLEDLASQRLGVDVTQKEAKTIYKLAQDIEGKLAKIPEDAPVKSKERIEYGMSKVVFEKYFNELKKGTPSLVKWMTDYLKNPSKIIIELAGATKSMLATLDNSFFGRQGLKVLFNSPIIWSKAFVKSFADFSKALVKIDAMDMIKADAYSRPNAINGKYKMGKFDIGEIVEEAFPSSIPEKIPLLGRVFKGSENAFMGAALRMRTDLADKYIKMAGNQGVDVASKKELEAIGRLVNSMTGRGNIGRLDVFGKEINAMFFSIKFLKSNFDTLTMHLFDKGATKFTKKQAAKNLFKITAGIAGTLTLAELMFPGSVETDPRSVDFGKIKIGDTRFDITGGMGSLFVLANRLRPTKREGEWGFWTKSSTTGENYKLNSKKYGARTALDMVEDFFENKFSPLAGLGRDILKGEHFGGENIAAKTILRNLTFPLSVQSMQELLANKNSAPLLQSLILEGLGIGTQTYSEKKKKIKSIK